MASKSKLKKQQQRALKKKQQKEREREQKRLLQQRREPSTLEKMLKVLEQIPEQVEEIAAQSKKAPDTVNIIALSDSLQKINAEVKNTKAIISGTKEIVKDEVEKLKDTKADDKRTEDKQPDIDSLDWGPDRADLKNTFNKIREDIEAVTDEVYSYYKIAGKGGKVTRWNKAWATAEAQAKAVTSSINEILTNLDTIAAGKYKLEDLENYRKITSYTIELQELVEDLQFKTYTEKDDNPEDNIDALNEMQMIARKILRLFVSDIKKLKSVQDEEPQLTF